MKYSLALCLISSAVGFQPLGTPIKRLTSLRARSAEDIFKGPPTGDDVSPAISGISLEEIAEQWLPSAASGLQLETRNTSFFKEEAYEVDVSKVGGLGLVLAEMWEENGRGLVLIEEIVTGSNAAKAKGIAVGDTIVGVVGSKGLAFGADTEGVDWETTVAALSGGVEGDNLKLMMKRLTLRGRMNVKVTASDGKDLGTFQCASGANLRMEFLRRGLPMNEIYDTQTMRFDAIGNAGSNCGGEGACGTCLVAVTDGFSLCNEPGRTEAKALLKQNRPIRWRWSCRTAVGDGSTSGDVSVQLQPQRGFKDEQEKIEGLGVGRK